MAPVIMRAIAAPAPVAVAAIIVPAAAIVVAVSAMAAFITAMATAATVAMPAWGIRAGNRCNRQTRNSQDGEQFPEGIHQFHRRQSLR